MRHRLGILLLLSWALPASAQWSHLTLETNRFGGGWREEPLPDDCDTDLSQANDAGGEPMMACAS